MTIQRKYSINSFQSGPRRRSRAGKFIDEEMGDFDDDDDVSPTKKGNTVDASMASTNVSSQNDKYQSSRAIVETTASKLFEMRNVFLSYIINAAMFYFIILMRNDILIPVSLETVGTFGCVVVEVMLIVSNAISLMALNDGAAAYFGYMFTDSKGYSLAVCGFYQASAFGKWNFCDQLSLNSSCRKLLSRLSILWIMLWLVLPITPISATSLAKETVHIDSGTTACYTYKEQGNTIDRGYPTIKSAAGFGEALMSGAIGLVRSQTKLNFTTSVLAPQLIGPASVNSKTTSIVGQGYTTNITSRCGCTTGTTAAAVVAFADHLSLTDAGNMLATYNSSSGYNMVNFLSPVNTSDSSIKITTLITESNLCGGYSHSFASICVTRFSDHRNATVQVDHVSESTSASITPKSVRIRNTTTPADMNWVYTSLSNILQGTTSTVQLPSTVPGVVNPLIWWTSNNFMSIDPTSFESGMETTFSMILRAGMQRTYRVVGKNCYLSIRDPVNTIVKLDTYGTAVALFTLGFQLFCTILATAAFVPWLKMRDPMGPCVRLLKDKVYFTGLLHTSTINIPYEDMCNAPSHQIWQNLDIVLNIGESINTCKDDIGHIVLDKAKKIRNFVNGRKYY